MWYDSLSIGFIICIQHVPALPSDLPPIPTVDEQHQHVAAQLLEDSVTKRRNHAAAVAARRGSGSSTPTLTSSPAGAAGPAFITPPSSPRLDDSINLSQGSLSSSWTAAGSAAPAAIDPNTEIAHSSVTAHTTGSSVSSSDSPARSQTMMQGARISISTSLLDKIRSKSSTVQADSAAGGPQLRARVRLLAQLPDFAKAVRSAMSSDRRTAIPLNQLVVTMSKVWSRQRQSEQDIVPLIECLASEVPEFLSITTSSAGTSITASISLDRC